jgi:sulfur-carrier protein adenylyltransferase/sulfurtransferase
MNINKYSRQISIPFVGVLGQEKIKDTKVTIIGAGALGHSTSIYLAASGIGHISIFDHDVVEESNLSRQILFSDQDIGKPKAKCLTEYLKKLHSDVEFHFFNKEFSVSNSNILPSNCNFIINASDNYTTRHAINLVSLKKNIPWIDLGILKTQGHFCLFKPGFGCYECLFPDTIDSTENCSLSGVLSPICGIIGSFAANEVIKFILGKYTKEVNHFFSFEFLENNFKKFYWKRNLECRYCNEFLKLRPNPVLKKIIYDNFFIDEHKLKEILQQENTLAVFLDEPTPHSSLNSVFETGDIQDKKENAKFINESIHSILNKNFSLIDNSKNAKYYSQFKLIVFLCRSGIKSKTACEIFRKHRFHSYYALNGL